MAERKKKQQHQDPSSEAVRPPSASVGETLHAARVAKKLELDDVSQAIHIRPSQLKAIEENNIEQLPGMTYAVGFVRSYANFLGLNGAEIVHRFKAEQGHSAAQSRLSFPEPIAESRVPDPMMVGVGAFLAVVILVAWTIYSNVHGAAKTATQIPPAPVVTSVADALPAATTPAPDAASATAPAATTTTATDQTAAAVSTPATPAVPAAAAAPATSAPAPAATDAAAGQPASPAVPVAATAPAATPATPPATTNKAAPEKTADKTAASTPAKDTEASDDSDDSEDSAAADDSDASAKKTADKKDSTIKIKAGKSRITLKASAASWVQVTDSHQNVLYRKVLRPGEQYAVPDQPGLVLDTANAGGLEIVVDGAAVQPVGKTGEIVRGVALDPKALKVKRVLVRD